MQVRAIAFSSLVEYWRETNHFQDPNKIYSEVLGHLGPFKSTVADPRRISYGLFQNDQMIGATHITEWNEQWIRFRTINIRAGFRGQDLGWRLLHRALQQDWAHSPWLFGWFRRHAHGWALGHGFRDVDGIWHGEHRACLLNLND
jgi:hypothetical protein